MIVTSIHRRRNYSSLVWANHSDNGDTLNGLFFHFGTLILLPSTKKLKLSHLRIGNSFLDGHVPRTPQLARYTVWNPKLWNAHDYQLDHVLLQNCAEIPPLYLLHTYTGILIFLTSILMLKCPSLSSMVSLMTWMAVFSLAIPSVLSRVVVVMTYWGGAIRLILMGISSVDWARPAFREAFTASIPSYP